MLDVRPIPKKRRSTTGLNSCYLKSKIVSAENQDSENLQFVRRTITIAPLINRAIQDFRIELMRKNPLTEYDYTSVANALMAYGVILLQDYEHDPEDEKKLIHLLGNRFQLAEYGLGDVIDTLRRSRPDAEPEMQSQVRSHENAKERKEKTTKS